jgi:hypothetical protein
MQRNPMQGDAARAEASDQFVGEMQSRRGRGDRSFMLCEDGLIVRAVPLVVGAARGDIGRQRNMAERFDRLVKDGAVKVET